MITFFRVMGCVWESYENAESWTTRHEILSIIASQIDFKPIQSFLPNLTLNRFTAACKYAAEFDYDTAIQQSPAAIHRFDHDHAEHFIEIYYVGVYLHLSPF